MTGLAIRLIPARLSLLDARECAVAVLVLLARAAGAGLVAPDLALVAHEGAGGFRHGQRPRRRIMPLRRAAWRRRARGLLGDREQRAGLGVLRLQCPHQAQSALLLLAFQILLGAHFD